MNQKILIIDDETDYCLIMKNYFRKKGKEVHTATTLKEGLALLKEIQPDILFLDNNLPDGQGWDALSEVVEIIPRIRVYLVSAHRNNSPHADSNNNIVVWEKPISLSLLETVLR